MTTSFQFSFASKTREDFNASVASVEQRAQVTNFTWSAGTGTICGTISNLGEFLDAGKITSAVPQIAPAKRRRGRPKKVATLPAVVLADLTERERIDLLLSVMEPKTEYSGAELNTQVHASLGQTADWYSNNLVDWAKGSVQFEDCRRGRGRPKTGPVMKLKNGLYRLR